MQGGNVQQRMAAHAQHLRAVPCQEGSGGEADLDRMLDAAQADRAALTVIQQRPAQAEEEEGEAAEHLNIRRGMRIMRGAEVGEIQR